MTDQVWLTQEAYERLRQEHGQLTGEGRDVIAKRIEEARAEGDLKENGGYHAAKEEQGKAEARIRQLEQLFRDAKVGEAPPSDGKAGPGMVVEVLFEGDKSNEKFLLGSREDHSTSVEVFSPQSPLGRAVSGHAAGDKVSYALPNGRQAALTIVAVAPYSG